VRRDVDGVGGYDGRDKTVGGVGWHTVKCDGRGNV
jgi:hypothetical protein